MLEMNDLDMIYNIYRKIIFICIIMKPTQNIIYL
jgi:hypothetical protein